SRSTRRRGRRCAAARHRITEPAQLFEMPFVDVPALPEHNAVATPDQLLVVVDDIRFAVAEHFDAFLAETGLRTERGVEQMREAAVLVRDGRAEVVVAPIR